MLGTTGEVHPLIDARQRPYSRQNFRMHPVARTGCYSIHTDFRVHADNERGAQSRLEYGIDAP